MNFEKELILKGSKEDRSKVRFLLSFAKSGTRSHKG